MSDELIIDTLKGNSSLSCLHVHST